MRTRLICCAALCSLALSGCKSVYSAHSLSTSEDAVEEPALVGQWISKDHSDDSFCVLRGDHNTYTMIVASDSKSEADTKPNDLSKPEQLPKVLVAYQITLVQLDNQLFADMVAAGQLVDGREVEPPVGSLFHHIILKLDLTDSDLGYSLLATDAIREAAQQGYAPLSYVEIDDDILLNGSTEELRWAVSHYADRLFRDSEEHYIKLTGSVADGTPPSPCSEGLSPLPVPNSN